MSQYILKNPSIEIYSYTPVEDVKATNDTLTGSIDSGTCSFSFHAKIGDFKFNSKLMQEHFNQKYMESTKYPESTLSGTIIGASDFEKEGQYPVIAKGEFTIHGSKNSVEIPATISVSKNGIILTSEFKIKLVDYGIEVPKMLFHKVAEVIDVKVSSDLVKS